MKPISPRSISAEEAAVVKQALLRAPAEAISADALSGAGALRVAGVCECGCRSIEFECASGAERQVADGVGFLESGEPVDIVVWARGNSISSLEIVDHGGKGELPLAETVCSWEEAGRNAS